MPIIPSFVERLLLLRFNQGPGPMLDFLGAQAFRTLSVAVKLDVFETLAGGGLTAAETARRIQADERGTTILLEALEALGYVMKEDGHFANTAMTSKWLLRRSPTNLADGIAFLEGMVFDRWGHLSDSIRRGKPVVAGEEWLSQHPGSYRVYEQGMIAAARIAADEVVAKAELASAARRLLDLGGGHGVYAVKFCRRYPNLSARVFDLPQALDVARETIAAEGIGDRISVQEGDFWIDDLGAGYDAVLLFNILHAFLPEKNKALLGKVARSLNWGGRIVILEPIAEELSSPAAKAFARLQSLNFFNDLEGQTYSFPEIASWIKETGFAGPKQVNLRKSPGFSLVLATKRG